MPPGLGHLAVADDDGVRQVAGLDDVPAGHGYADRVHEEESFPSFPRWCARVLLDERLARSPVARRARPTSPP